MHFPFFFFKMCAHICFFELDESVWERKKVILKCAFELVQKLVWEHLKKSSAQNVEILLISSSQKTSLNTYKSNLRELVDKQLLEIKKKTHFPFFSFKTCAHVCFFELVVSLWEHKPENNIFQKSFFVFTSSQSVCRQQKFKSFRTKPVKLLRPQFRQNFIKIDFLTNPTSKCCSENWKMVLRTQAGNFCWNNNFCSIL